MRLRHRRIGFWYRFAVVVLKPLLVLFTKREWVGAEHIPATGGVIIAANHISTVDPLTLGYFVFDTGRLPRFLAKDTLFKSGFIGRVFKGTGQIPVARGTADAAIALTAAVEALHQGECVLIYPEGTATRDPDIWPMQARTGIARLALTSGVPVIPVAQWGAQELLPYPTTKPKLLPRKKIQVLAGPPIDLSKWDGAPHDAMVLREVTDEIMTTVTELLVSLRGGEAPEKFFQPEPNA